MVERPNQFFISPSKKISISANVGPHSPSDSNHFTIIHSKPLTKQLDRGGGGCSHQESRVWGGIKRGVEQGACVEAGWGYFDELPRQGHASILYRVQVVRSGRGNSGATHGWVAVIARSSHQFAWETCHQKGRGGGFHFWFGTLLKGDHVTPHVEGDEVVH